MQEGYGRSTVPGSTVVHIQHGAEGYMLQCFHCVKALGTVHLMGYMYVFVLSNENHFELPYEINTC